MHVVSQVAEKVENCRYFFAACRADFSATTAIMTGMTPHMRPRGRPPKGDRVRVILRGLPQPVQSWTQKVAADNHSTVSQVVADVMAEAAGYPELVLELRLNALPVVSTLPAHPNEAPPAPNARAGLYTRLPRPVQEWAQKVAADNHSTVSQVVADVMAEAAGYPELVLELGQEVTPQSA